MGRLECAYVHVKDKCMVDDKQCFTRMKIFRE